MRNRWNRKQQGCPCCAVSRRFLVALKSAWQYGNAVIASNTQWFSHLHSPFRGSSASLLLMQPNMPAGLLREKGAAGDRRGEALQAPASECCTSPAPGSCQTPQSKAATWSMCQFQQEGVAVFWKYSCRCVSLAIFQLCPHIMLHSVPLPLPLQSY